MSPCGLSRTFQQMLLRWHQQLTEGGMWVRPERVSFASSSPNNSQHASHFIISNQMVWPMLSRAGPGPWRWTTQGRGASSALECLHDLEQVMSLSSSSSSAKYRSPGPHRVFVRIVTLHKARALEHSQRPVHMQRCFHSNQKSAGV